MNVINEIKTLLGMELNLAQMKLKDGVTVLEADAFEMDNNVFIVNGEEKIPVPVGEYELEDGMILVVAVEGIIAEIKEPVVEMPEEEAPEVEIEVEAQSEVAIPKRIVESVSKEMFFAEIEKLRTEIAELKLAKEVVKEELSSDVIFENVEPLTHSPEVKNEVKLNKLSPNRQMTTQDLVMAKLFN
jgi:ABC-type ATPase with predicted acetyltransferase domain